MLYINKKHPRYKSKACSPNSTVAERVGTGDGENRGMIAVPGLNVHYGRR